MNKTELCAEVAKVAGLDAKATGHVLDALAKVTTTVLTDGGEITLTGIGKFGVVKRPARTGRNPATGAELQIAESTKPKFKAAKSLQDAINKAA